MGTGRLSDEMLADAMTEARVPGDFAEVGVYRGHLFTRLARYAAGRQLVAHAFDSFAGMAEPGPLDGPGYPRGAMSVGGVQAFRSLLNEAGAPEESYELHPGFIPECFNGFFGPLAFCYVDVDHYLPTKLALEWAAEHMTPGGVLGMDDYFPGRQLFATPAIERFMARWQPEVLREENNQLFVRWV